MCGFIGKSCFFLGFFGFWGGFLGKVYFLLKKVDLISRIEYSSAIRKLLCRTGSKSFGVSSITAWLTQASGGAKSGPHVCYRR